MRRNKVITLILILIFPTILSLGSFVTNTRAGPEIPEDDPKNNWHWGVDVGDKLMFEVEIVVTNNASQEVTNMYRNHEIYNITSIYNVTGDLYGFYPFQNFSKIEIDLLWEDSVGVLSASPLTDVPLALFGYNKTLNKVFYEAVTGMLAPMVFPINDTILDVALMADIYNETSLDPITKQLGFFNIFDDYSVDVGKTEIYFQNTTDDYFFRASYYPNNGTMKDFDGYFAMNMGEWMLLNVTGKRVFEHDITDEVVWGVKPGDIIYYNVNQTGSGAFLTKIEVEGFNKSVYWSRNWTMYSMDWPMVFDNVIVTMSAWNGTGWEELISSSPFVAANNYYPVCFPLMESMAGQSGFILPISATLDDFKFLINNDTHHITGWFPFDLVYYDVSGNIINMTMIQSGGQTVWAIIDSSTGFIDIQAAYYMGDLVMYVEKVDELLEWAIDVGDVLYFKQNIQDDLQEVRLTITSFNQTFIDMSTTGFPLPTGQPNLQFFTEIYAEFAQWHKDDEIWYTYGENLFAAANEYWPIAPFAMMGTFPLYFPEGTVATDFQNMFDMMAFMFDDITYNPGQIIMRNTTANKELQMHFDETTGRMTYLGGDNMMGPEWFHMSVYPEYIENLIPGANHFTLQSDFSMDATVTADIVSATGGPGVDYLYALLPFNPIGTPLPNGTALLYMDTKITDHTQIVGNVSMTVILPSSLDLSTLDIFLYAWNMSGTSEWDEPPPEFWYSVTFNYIANSITFEFPTEIPWAVISAMSYQVREEPEDGEPEIPGFDLFLISLLIVVISAIVIKRKLKRKL